VSAPSDEDAAKLGEEDKKYKARLHKFIELARKVGLFPPEPEPDPPSCDTGNPAVLRPLEKEYGLQFAPEVLTGNEAYLSSEQKALLSRFNSMAEKMGIHPAPVLFRALWQTKAEPGCSPFPLDGSSPDDWPNANAYITRDGTAFVEILVSGEDALQAKTRADGSAFTTSPQERQDAILAHELAHIKHKDPAQEVDAEPSVKRALGSLVQEAAADKTAAETTCNPQALADALESLDLAAARKLGKTIQRSHLDEVKDMLNDPDPHPPTFIRVDMLQYMKDHPSSGCKKR
jgi:hypothetical protein